jgi:hypothetical protein
MALGHLIVTLCYRGEPMSNEESKYKYLLVHGRKKLYTNYTELAKHFLVAENGQVEIDIPRKEKRKYTKKKPQITSSSNEQQVT